MRGRRGEVVRRRMERNEGDEGRNIKRRIERTRENGKKMMERKER